MFALRARFLIAVFWVGSLWTVGYLVAPTLFHTLSDRALAGAIAASVFRVEAWVSIDCAIALALLVMLAPNAETAKQGNILLILIFCMFACTLISHFGLQPLMAELRMSMGSGSAMASDARMQFGILHGVSSAIYLIESLLGVALIFKIQQHAKP